MSTSGTQCSLCGTQILQSTADKTGGVCRVCERRVHHPGFKQAIETGVLPKASLFLPETKTRDEPLPDTVAEPDLVADEDRLVKFTAKAIRSFAAKHADEVFSYFAFDCNADYGEVLLCLDTESNSIVEAKKHEDRVTEARSTLAYNDSFQVEWAIHTVQNPVTGPVLPFGDNTGDFVYQGFAEIRFSEWEDYTLAENYPGSFEESGSDYMESLATILFSRATDALVQQGAFDCLNRSSPFLVGFGLHDGPQVVLRIVNW